MAKNAIQVFIEEYGFSSKELAGHLGVSNAAISKWRNDDREVPPYIIKSLFYFGEYMLNKRKTQEIAKLVAEVEEFKERVKKINADLAHYPDFKPIEINE